MSKALNLQQLHKKAIPVYKKASDLALKLFIKGVSSYDVKTDRGLQSIVTEADRSVNEVLVKGLTNLIPGSTVFSEEGERTMSDGYTWILDPIDGTSNFQVGIELWGIAISLRKGGETVYAVLIFPGLMEKMFYGFAEKGTYTSAGKRVRPVPAKGFKIKFAIGGPDVDFRNTISELDFGKKQSVVRYGGLAAEAYALLRGGLDFVFAYKLDIYDVDAACLLAQEAGYKVKYFNKPEKDGYVCKVLMAKEDVFDQVYKELKKAVSKHESVK